MNSIGRIMNLPLYISGKPLWGGWKVKVNSTNSKNSKRPTNSTNTTLSMRRRLLSFFLFLGIGLLAMMLWAIIVTIFYLIVMHSSTLSFAVWLTIFIGLLILMSLWLFRS